MTATLETQTIPLIDATAYDRPSASIELEQQKLIDMWDAGAIPKASFVVFALLFEDLSKPLDLENFCYRWRGTVDPDTSREKKLKPIDVERVLLGLKAKNLLDQAPSPIQLTLNF